MARKRMFYQVFETKLHCPASSGFANFVYALATSVDISSPIYLLFSFRVLDPTIEWNNISSVC
jgi:hypothetical protein